MTAPDEDTAGWAVWAEDTYVDPFEGMDASQEFDFDQDEES